MSALDRCVDATRPPINHHRGFPFVSTHVPNQLPHIRSMLRVLLFAALLVGLPSALTPTSAHALQEGVVWDPARLHVTRAELEDLMARYEAVAQSSGYGGGMREDARRAAARIATRLQEGDFRVGDRIWLQVEGEAEVPDTLLVEPGPSVQLPNMGRIDLAGVLRSELQEHMTRELSRYIQNPEVRTQSTIRLQIRGAVGNQGFHVFPSDMLLSDAIMAAGGPSQAADWDDLHLERAGERIMDPDEVTVALADGRSLDHLGLQAGDILVVPEDRPSAIWPTVFRWTAIIASTTLLGIRIF